MECVSPIYVKRLGSTVRCGSCPACREYAQRSWAVRLHAELQRAETAYFITLTYDEDSIYKCDWGFLDSKEQFPFKEAIDQDNFSQMRPKLTKSHLTLFLKRLSNYLSQGMPEYIQQHYPSLNRLKMASTVKHFAVGEYGSKNLRPHWHILLFNYPYNQSDLGNIIKFAWHDGSEKHKSMGFSHIGIIKGGSIDYVTGYLLKNARDKEVRFISKGIGLSYLKPDLVRYHQKTLDGVVRIDGKKLVMPRYIKDKIFTRREKEAIMEKHFQAMMDEKEKNPKLLGEQFNYLEQKIKLKQSKK